MNYKLDKIIFLIEMAMNDYCPVEDTSNNEIRTSANMFINMAQDSYILVQWPESQDYMEESWFKEEAVLALGNEEKTGSGAYFIPLKRMI